MIKAAAEQHKAMFDKLLNESGEKVNVVQPPVRQASVGGDTSRKIFGPTDFETGDGTSSKIKAIISSTSTIEMDMQSPERVRQLGNLHPSDLVLRVKVSDALSDSDRPYGGTIFDTARRVEVRGSNFQVTGSFRTGLPPLEPYILWVGLKLTGDKT